LLDTYDSERRPVAEHTLEKALARLQAWFKDESERLPPAKAQVDDYAVVFGHLYHQGAILGEPLPERLEFESAQTLSGRPGSRAPHLMLMRNHEQLSILDVFGAGFVLLTGTCGREWCEAVSAIQLCDFRLECFSIGRNGDLEHSDDGWPTRYGVAADGAVLVRPDGFVAWRSRVLVEDPRTTLAEVFRQLGFDAKVQPRLDTTGSRSAAATAARHATG
jgi:hypothetical protein